MKTGDLIAKLARGEKLGVGEIEALRLKLNEQQNVASNSGSYLSGSSLSFPGRPEDSFVYSDHQLGTILRYTTSQTIANSLNWTDVTFENIISGIELLST